MPIEKITQSGISASEVVFGREVNATRVFEQLADGTVAKAGPSTLPSWTPALAFGGASTGITYSTQVGRYYRIGSLICAFFNITLTSKGSATGAMTISGLPVAVNANAQYTPGHIFFASGAASLTAPILRVTTATTMEVMNQAATALTAATEANATDAMIARGFIQYLA